MSASLRRAVAYFEGGAAADYGDETVALPADYFVGCEEPPLPRRRGQAGDNDYDEIYAERRPPTQLALVPQQRATFCLIAPREFNDAQEIADRFCGGAAVFCNLQGCEAALARRLTDFCSGLAYALEGSLAGRGEGLLLLVPHNVELSSEAAAGPQAQAFFNQI